jgi:DNA-binding LytR/AlgR family response regulator
MLRCIAIDDEELALELLEDNIRKVPGLQLAGAYTNPLEGLQVLQQGGIDLVFLDIQMPGITGLQFIQSVSKKCLFILVTAYENYALEGFNLQVVDYLVKPVAFDRFVLACTRAQELHRLQQGNFSGGEKAAPPAFFFVPADYRMLKVVFDDIIWIEGLKDYVKIHLRSEAQPTVVRISMKALEDQLPQEQFLRIHKSYIVSKNAITALRKNSIFLNKLELPVGDAYREAVNALVQGSRNEER